MSSSSSLPLLTVIPFSHKKEKPSFLPSLKLRLKNVHRSEANALPRVLVRWVQTVGVCMVTNNTQYAKSHVEFHQSPLEPTSEKLRTHLEQISWRIPSDLLEPFSEFSTLNALNSLKFVLRKTHIPEDPEDVGRKTPGLYKEGLIVTTADAIWIPHDQAQRDRVERYYQSHPQFKLFLSDQQPHMNQVCRPDYEDRILATLTPGESIDVTFYLTLCNTTFIKHYGGSPVTARTVLRLKPTVNIVEPITDVEDIELALKLCNKGVFKEEKDNETGKSRLAVKNAQNCTHCMLCREITRPERIELDDLEDEFDVLVETRNGIPLYPLIRRGFSHLIQVCNSYLEALEKF
ncbi:MAG: hypothetical protein Sylvanvirus1_55 [Sylvanvirus sp.]|uniref:Uncharacterized protein n=1 Tax=Sylvanvirus sp. TaxID=2487774 RepID=A0A3G5AKL3_9VIRU|nr:MAG: hypothetical protein Sylvanvirus1_55 [Sylvanvirus sp.]